ncbi:PREDICTED: adrenodoxin, mitochondrial-like, partial [Nestor notabilis]|uniref:adrenodoxin, mitochondrial-like n=1 Tax=Nestor notabilis TaxID=176057 RepID=UPI00052353A8
ISGELGASPVTETNLLVFKLLLFCDDLIAVAGGCACEGTLACSTCHLIFEDHIFEKLDAITDEEMDMLDLAYGLTETNRILCQICLKKSMDGMTVRVPEAVADARQSVDMSKNS